MNQGRGNDNAVCESAPDYEVAAPRWLELLALAAGLAISSVGVVGLVLALAGLYSALVTLALALPLLGVSMVLVARALPSRQVARSTVVAALVAVVVALAFGAFAGSRPSQNVLVDRDPGAYTNTARGLANEGTLEIDARGEAFAGVSGLSFTSQAVYDVGPLGSVEPGGEPQASGEIEFQFNHLTSVVLATAYDVGGIRAMFRLPALASAAGLLAVYAVAVRAARRPWAALLAPGLLAFTLPMLYVSRNTYSEPFTLVPLWGAVLALSIFHRRPRLGLAVVGGFLLGATVCVRVDALLYVALAVPLAGVSMATATADMRSDRLRGWLAAGLAALVPMAIGIYDLSARTGAYIDDLADQISLLRLGGLALVAITVVGVAGWTRWPAVRSLAQRWRGPSAAVGAGLVGAVFLVAWLVRPRVQTGQLEHPIGLVGVLQQRDGLTWDPYASYAEDSLQWMAWYLGAPALVAAIAGLVWVTHRSLRGRVEPAALATLVLCLGGGGLYWWEPSITPDQLWATRRFVPAAIPALAVMASVALSAVAGWAHRHGGGRSMGIGRPLLLCVLAIGLIVPAGQATSAVRDHTMQQGFVLPIEQLCDGLPDDAAVLVVGASARLILQQGVRSWCGVPTAAEASPLSQQDVVDMANEVASNGHQLYLVSRDEAGITDWATIDPGGISATDLAVNDTNALATLDRAPRGYGGAFGLQLFYVPVGLT